MLLKACNDIVIVDPDPIEPISKVLAIPDTLEFYDQDRCHKGTVLSVGPDCNVLKVGDKVIYGKFSIDRKKIDNKIKVFIREMHVLALIDA